MSEKEFEDFKKAIMDSFEFYDIGFNTKEQVIEEICELAVPKLMPALEKDGYVILSKKTTIKDLLSQTKTLKK